jgi:hypothetical protein
MKAILDEAPKENALESIMPSESPTVIQASCQRNQDDCRQRFLGKRRRLTVFDPVDNKLHGLHEATNAVENYRQMPNVCTACSNT